jgi:hypothetical protein
VTEPQVTIGVIIAPRFERESNEIAAELTEDLRESFGSVQWQTELVVDPLVSPPATSTDILEAARRKLLERDWDLALVVTDLPLRAGRRPVMRQVSPILGIAVVSVPALGAVQLRGRLRRTLLELVGDLVGDNTGDALQELATDTDERAGGLSLLFVPTVLFGNLWLLLGMVRANRPWRLATRLYRALVAALAAGAFGVVTLDIWRVSAAMDWWRLVATSLLSITITVVAVIAAHGLWERAPDPRVREQVVLFNFATAGTVIVGILTLYAALFVLILLGASLVIAPSLFERTLGHDVGIDDYVRLAWFVASLATVGGGLGAALESDDAVREAAYTSSAEDEP